MAAGRTPARALLATLVLLVGTSTLGVTGAQAATGSDTTPATDLSVMLNGVPAVVAAGAGFSVSATVTNSGPDALAAGSATVAFALPSGLYHGLLPNGCTASSTSTSTTVTCAVPATAVTASSTTAGFTVTAARPAGVSRTVTATVTTAGQDPDSTDNTDTDTVDVVVSTDLSPTLHGVPATTAVGGGAFDVHATVANAGPSDLAAGEATVTITIPTGLAFGPTPAGCTPVTGSTTSGITCPVAATAAGSTSAPTATLSVSGTRPAGSRAITATVDTTDPGQDGTATNDTDSDTVGVVVSTDLSPTVNVPSSVVSGTVFHVNATVLNTGPSDLAAGEATASITLPSGLTFEGAPAGCVASTSTASTTSMTCPVPAIARGATAATASLPVSGAAPGTRTVTAAVQTVAPGQDPSPGNNTDSDVVTVGGSTDLSPTLVGVPATTAAGGAPFSVHATVSNAGPHALAAGEASVDITIPSGLTFGPLPPECTSSSTASTSTITCPVAATAAGSTSAPTAALAISGNRPAGSRSVTATVRTAVTDQDPDPADDTDTENVTVVVQTDLSAMLSGVPSTTAVGGPAFNVSAPVHNSGASDLAAGEATLTLTIAAGLTFGPTPSGCTSTATASSSSITCPVPPTASGATASMPSVAVTGNRPEGSRAVTATVNTADPNQDQNGANNTDTDHVTVLVATDLSPTLLGVPAAAPNDTVFDVQATVLNGGPSDLAAGEATVTFTVGTGLAFTATPATCTAPTASTITCPVAATASGTSSSPTSSISIRATAPGIRTVTATVDTIDAGQDANSTNDSDSQAVEVQGPVASVGPASLNFGDQQVGTTATLPVTVTNSGNSPLTLSGLSASGGFTIADSTTCTDATTLAATESCTIGVSFAPQIPSPHTGTLSVSHNASASPSTVALAGNGTLSADLVLSMGADPTPVRSGAKLAYRIGVRNDGPTDASALVLTDQLPAGVQFVKVDAPGWSCTAPPVGATGEVRCTRASMAIGATSTVILVVKVVEAGRKTITNTARVTADSADPNLANNSVTVDTPTYGRR